MVTGSFCGKKVTWIMEVSATLVYSIECEGSAEEDVVGFVLWSYSLYVLLS